MALLIYGLMALTPMIPKRLFLPLALYNLVMSLASLPLIIAFFGQMHLIAWGLSMGQALLGLVTFFRIQGSFKFRWPLVSTDLLVQLRFSWGNLAGFVLVNVLVLLPAFVAYLLVGTAMAVNHVSEGFVALHLNGISVQVRKYLRADGKVVELFPMAHIADAGFYQRVSQTFPTNSLILMEGVSDDQNLLTNKISYKRMARSLGLSEQHEEFVPERGTVVRADIDISKFSKETIGFLNLIMLVHAKGFNPSLLEKMAQYSPPPHFEKQLFDDLLNLRNQHLLEEIHARLLEADNLMVPWGAAHMPGIAQGLQKDGFHMGSTTNYMVIRFRGFGGGDRAARP